MSQRRGSSCELKKPHGKVTETRRFTVQVIIIFLIMGGKTLFLLHALNLKVLEALLQIVESH